MDLELADYQRTIESLEQRIRDKDAEIATCKDETAQKDRLIDAIKRETRKLPYLIYMQSGHTSLQTVLCILYSLQLVCFAGWTNM